MNSIMDQSGGGFVGSAPDVPADPDDWLLWPVATYLFAAPDYPTSLRRVVERAQARDVVEVPGTAATPALDYPLLDGRRPPGSVRAVPLEVDSAVIAGLTAEECARVGLCPAATACSAC